MDLKSKITLRTGNEIPVMGLGTWEILEDTAGIVQTAIQIGYQLIDTSGDYGTQPGISEAIKLSGVDRQNIFIVTKVEETDDAYKALEKNLVELGLSYVDLVLIHRPPKEGSGATLWRSLIDAKKDGLTKDIGVSNYSIDLLNALSVETGVVPVVNQIEWSPFGHSEEMLSYARENHIVIMAYSPLTRGKRINDQVISDIATKYAKTPAQIIIRWNIQRGTIPIPKSSQVRHLKENTEVFDFEIDNDEMEILNGLDNSYSALGGLPYK